MGNLDRALQAQDSAMFNPADFVWTADQLERAKNRLYNQIMDGRFWDENLEGYRMDMFVDIERVILDKTMPSEEKMAEIRDIHHKAVMNFVEDEVWKDPSKYCVEGF